MRKKLVLLLIALCFVFVSGCGKKDDTEGDNTANPSVTQAATEAPTQAATEAPTQGATAAPTQGAYVTTTPDVATTASIVNDEEAFKKAISADGTWIIATLKNMTFDEELVLEGEFKNGKKDENGKDIIQRKIALYEQDNNRNITAKYVLTAPKLTIKSPNARIQSGAFHGDIYVEATNFQLVDAVVDGNVYFTNQKAMDTFTMDETSSITGTKELKK